MSGHSQNEEQGDDSPRDSGRPVVWTGLVVDIINYNVLPDEPRVVKGA